LKEALQEAAQAVLLLCCSKLRRPLLVF